MTSVLIHFHDKRYVIPLKGNIDLHFQGIYGVSCECVCTIYKELTIDTIAECCAEHTTFKTMGT